MGLHNHGCVKAESRMLRNPHVWFGGRRLETQIKLCAGRLPYFILFSNDKRELMKWRNAIVKRLQRYRLTIHQGSAHPKKVSEGLPFLGFIIFPDFRRLKSRKGLHFRKKLKQDLLHARKEKIQASLGGWINHVRYGNTIGLRRSLLSELGLLAAEEYDAR